MFHQTFTFSFVSANKMENLFPQTISHGNGENGNYLDM